MHQWTEQDCYAKLKRLASANQQHKSFQPRGHLNAHMPMHTGP